MFNKRKITRALIVCIIIKIILFCLVCTEPVRAEGNPSGDKGWQNRKIEIANIGETGGQSTNSADSREIEDRIIEEQMKGDEIFQIKKNLEKYSDNEIYKILPEYDPDKILQDAVRGRFDPGLPGLVQRIMNFLFKEIYINLNIMAKLLVLTVFCAILGNLKTSFLSDSVGELGFYACYTVIVSILIIGFNTALTMVRETIDSMVAFMHSTVPVLVTLLVSSGNIASGGVFQPVLIMAVEICATILKNFFVPLIFLTAVLAITNNITSRFQVSRLVGMLKSICIWCLGIILTVFAALTVVYGSMGAVVDGVTGKTAKLAIGFIPVAGKYLADAAEAVVSCTLLIKNAAGLAVMAGIIAICLVPVLKILALTVIYKFVGALIEPLTENRISNCVSEMAGLLSHLMAIVVSVAVMFLISTTAIISAGNISTMIR
ncbi:MAG TPA: stage III sporulation protein AE [Clostridiaceae bacterium]|nr:stage III sporulation protein AE [Clostridiaceae bacterium]